MGIGFYLQFPFAQHSLEAAFLVAIISLFYRETAPSRLIVSAPEPEAARASA